MNYQPLGEDLILEMLRADDEPASREIISTACI